MGNEGSVPEGHEAGDEFEQQARAPPSYTNPPQPTSQARSAGGRIAKTLRRDKNKQNIPGEAGDMSSGNGYVLNGEGGERVTMTSEQQRQYYQQHMTPNQNQYSSQPPQQQYAPATAQHKINVTGSLQHEAGSNYASPPRGKKGGMNFRSSGRGAAIINSMKSLSISNAIQKAADKAKSGKGGGAAGEVNEWETRWDEDDDDEDDESDEATEQTGSHAHKPLHAQDGSLAEAPKTVLVGEENWPPPQQKARLVTATPESGIRPQQPGAIAGGWDTGIVPTLHSHEKPNVHMFLPLLRVLGKGSFGKKRKGKERGALFAMKILRKSHLVKRRQIERTRTEREVLSVVNHPFIMKLHYAFQSPEKLYLVLDYCPGGELFFHLSRFRRFPERVARFYAAELLLALGHLHKRGIIYRDLKPENVLLDADGHIKLGDFGLAKAGIRHACEGATSMCGTPEYMAPEVLAQQGHGFCVDYWGLGMLVYEMMTGLPPWYTTDRAKLFRRLRSAPLDVPSYFSQSAAACVGALLERNPRRRLGVTGVRAAMEHDFFRSISWRALYGRRVEPPVRPCEGWNPPEAVPDDQQTVPTAWNENGDDLLNLEAATANFDNTFTRMPLDTEDNNGNHSDEDDLDELNEDTFIGFTFDNKDRDNRVAATLPTRQRTHHSYHPTTNEMGHDGPRQLD
eukprot:scaffold1888_cov120-Cylindrotheca_fusiformis.AAC.21